MFSKQPLEPLLDVRTTQADATDFVSITPVEIRSRQFPWDKDEILENLKDENLHAVKTMVNYKCHAWCLFSVVEGGDLVIHRLACKEDHLKEVLTNLFDTMTVSPKKVGCHISLNWPEYGTDDPVFRHLLETGWVTAGLIKDHYTAYGQQWDGIKLEKHFVR